MFTCSQLTISSTEHGSPEAWVVWSVSPPAHGTWSHISPSSDVETLRSEHVTITTPHFPLFSSLVASMWHLWASQDGWETAQTGGHYSWPGCDTDNLVSIISQTLSRPQLSSSPGMAITTRDTNWVPNIFQWLPMETIGSMIKVLRHRNCPSLHCGESFKRPRLSLQATVMFQVSGCSWAQARCTLGISRGWLCCKYVVHTAQGDLKPARVDKLIFNNVLRMILDIMLRTFILFIKKFNITAECLSDRSGSIQCFWSNIYGKKWRQHQNWNCLNKTLFGKAFSDIVSCLQLVIGTYIEALLYIDCMQQKSFHLKSGGTQISSSLFTDHKVELWT